MKIEEITGKETIADQVTFIRQGGGSVDVDQFRKEYGVKTHNIHSLVLRPKRKVKQTDGTEKQIDRNRLALPLQKRIVNSAVSFTFGNPVQLNCETRNERQKQVLNAVQRILFDNKSASLNRRMARNLFRSTEVAELWYATEYKSDKEAVHETYGFKTNVKLRSKLFSPWLGDTLYPVYNAGGDMVAFCREYERIETGDVRVRYMDCYTDEETIVWKKAAYAWEEVSRQAQIIGKIPIIYAKQDEPEWADVQYSIDRLETLLSNFGDTNDYHGSPKLFAEGKILGWAEKGEPGAIIEGEKGATLKYLSWDHAPESVKLEIETLLRFIYSFTQTPDISFDSVKGLREISGQALKMLFLDAHLKVQEKREVLDEYLQRRMNVLLAFVGTMNKDALKAEAEMLEIIPEIIPYMVDDEKRSLENLNLSSEYLSRRTRLRLSGLIDEDSIDDEMEQVKKERQEDNLNFITEPTV